MIFMFDQQERQTKGEDDASNPLFMTFAAAASEIPAALRLQRFRWLCL
jgi:hypothetical protein